MDKFVKDTLVDVAANETHFFAVTNEPHSNVYFSAAATPWDFHNVNGSQFDDVHRIVAGRHFVVGANSGGEILVWSPKSMGAKAGRKLLSPGLVCDVPLPDSFEIVQMDASGEYFCALLEECTMNDDVDNDEDDNHNGVPLVRLRSRY